MSEKVAEILYTMSVVGLWLFFTGIMLHWLLS
jgi:hypothetical protein